MRLAVRLFWFCALVAAPAPASAASGSFSTLTYNVAGLPQGISSAPSDRLPATQLLSCFVNTFDIVNVQEDFNYHAALYDTCDNHPYRSPTSGGAGFGSGLNTMSRFWYDDWDRVQWNNCNGVDCLTPKGFTMARMRLQEGVYVDIYNLHTQAQTETADETARRANILQLIGYVESVSAGHAVIVMGDTNTRYTRADDNIWELLNRGFTDVWVKKIRSGVLPAAGANALVCDPAYTSYNCEVVDKVFYRNSGYVNLEPTEYRVRTDTQNPAGQELSDHRPVQVNWTYSTDPNVQLSDGWGGPHGDAFDDVSLLPDKQDPRYCLDNGGQFGNGAILTVWNCMGNANQRFAADSNAGKIRMRSMLDEVVDGYGTSNGAVVVGTWGFWGGQNQLWDFVP